jgi:hypothetical protein
MPIKSLFVPSHAIQGEEVPAHILWDSLEYQSIKIQLPEGIKLKEIYNVREGMFDILGNEVVVKGVEVDGYLGMLFSTRKLREYTVDVEIKFSFINKEGRKIVEELKTIHLFRPELEIIEMPETITVDVERNYVTNRIRLKKCGQGTLVINFNTLKESELQKKVPNSIEEFLRNIKKDLETNFTEVKKAFPKYSNILDQYAAFVIDGIYALVTQLSSIFLPDRFRDFLDITPPFRYFNSKFGTDFYDFPGQVVPRTVKVTSRTDLSLEVPATEGKIIYKKLDLLKELEKVFK